MPNSNSKDIIAKRLQADVHLGAFITQFVDSKLISPLLQGILREWLDTRDDITFNAIVDFMAEAHELTSEMLKEDLHESK